jgi:hypothetical protein
MKGKRETPIEIHKNEFKKIGHQLIDTIAEFIETIDQRPVTPTKTTSKRPNWTGSRTLPDVGQSPEGILSNAADLLLNHSLLNGHPKFLGYITSSAAPIGALADLLAASVNPTVGAQI